MAITSNLGVGSGIDINGLVDQLVKADGQPAFASIQRRESAVNERISALGRLKGALSDFQTATGKLNELGTFDKHTASSSDEGIVKATAGLNAAAGNYQIEVQQLAQAHKLISNGYTDGAAVVGSGTLAITAGGSSFNVTIDSSNHTLAGIRDAINQATDNTGVNASIINVDDGTGGTVSKLVLTASKTGIANAISVAVTENAADPGLSALAYGAGAGATALTQVNAAQDAKIAVDGQTATRSTNNFSDVIQGVTLDLKKAQPGTLVDVNVVLDEGSIKDVTDGFVKAYNGLMGIVKDLGKFDSNSKAAGALQGDYLLREVKQQIRGSVTEVVSSAAGAYNSLAMIGISVDKDGVMAKDSAAFSKALKQNVHAVSDVFSSSNGVAARLSGRLDQYLQSGGMLDTQTTSLNKQLRRLSDEKDNVQLRLDNYRKTLMKQFIAMDVAVGQFQSKGAYLAQQLAKL